MWKAKALLGFLAVAILVGGSRGIAATLTGGILVEHPPAVEQFITNANSVLRVVQTDEKANLVIKGDGWFVVREISTGKNYVTRHGTFCLDANGFLVWQWPHNKCGDLRLQGFTDSGLSVPGDLRVDGTQAGGTAGLASFEIQPDGIIALTFTDGTHSTAGQVTLQNFRDPLRLQREDHRLYSTTEQAGGLSHPAAPGSAGCGELLPQWVETTPEAVRLEFSPAAEQAGPLAQGVLTDTANPTDLGIEGPGFFLVRNPQTDELFATRAGLFLIDANGYLITYDGLRVQGYSEPSLASEGDIKIDSAWGTSGLPTEAVKCNEFFLPDGRVEVRLVDGTQFTRGQILLYSFAHPERLAAAGRGLYAGVSEAQARRTSESRLRQGSLELINVPSELLATCQTLSFFPQGRIEKDDNPTHLAINGRGFFLLRDPRDGQLLTTRNGGFHLGESGYLISSEGFRLQGYSTPAMETIGDLRIDSGSASNTVACFRIDELGNLIVQLEDGTEFTRGRVLLQDYAAAYLLKSAGNTCYTNLAEAYPLPALTSPNTAGLGRIRSYALEVPAAPEELSLPSRQGPRLKITGEPGSTWTIQASSDGRHWATLSQVTNAPAELEFSDTSPKPDAHRFYRVAATVP